MVIMLAADLCRLILREQPARLLASLQASSTSGDEVVVSAITYAELIAGVLLTEKQAHHMALVQAFCERLEDVAPWDRAAVDCYTAIQQEAMRGGRALNMNDAMVAAHALSLDAVLWTTHPKAFTAIAGLRVRAWEEVG